MSQAEPTTLNEQDASQSDRDGASSLSTNNSRLSESSNEPLHIDIAKAQLATYFQLFNDLQHFNVAGNEALKDSIIGHSLWSNLEKDQFFRSLRRHGSNDTIAIAKDIDSKSEIEVQQYLDYLQEASLEEKDAALDTSDPAFLSADVVSSSLSAALEETASVIEANLHDQICAAEQESYGPYWIIDEGRAETIEEDLLIDEEHAMDLDSQMASFGLLRQTAFVELMRNVFMNSTADRMTNDSLIHTLDSEGPSILRSAFEDFYQIALSLTQRLVHAVVIQAISRLRADRDRRKVPIIRSHDVFATLDVLNMKASLDPRFWLDAVRDLKVLSRSKKLKRDASSTPRHGFLLTQEELQQKLEVEEASSSDSDSDDSSSSPVASGSSGDQGAVYDHGVHETDEPSSGGDSDSDVYHLLSKQEVEGERIMKQRDLAQSFSHEAELRKAFRLPLLRQIAVEKKGTTQKRPVKRRRIDSTTSASDDTQDHNIENAERLQYKVESSDEYEQG